MNKKIQEACAKRSLHVSQDFCFKYKLLSLNTFLFACRWLKWRPFALPYIAFFQEAAGTYPLIQVS